MNKCITQQVLKRVYIEEGCAFSLYEFEIS